MKFNTYAASAVSGKNAKRFALGSCNGTGAIDCLLTSFGLNFRQTFKPILREDKSYNYTVISLNDTNDFGTFRNAINTINSIDYSNYDILTITFSITGTINITSDLPVIVRSVSIISNGSVEIKLNNFDGLTINSDKSLIKGLSITGSKNSGLIINGKYNTVENCYIYKNNQNGILLNKNSESNIIGKNQTLDSNYVSNILYNNGSNGIEINASNNNIIQTNYIGTITGTTSAPNNDNGIYITSNSYGNIIGGKVFENSDGLINNPTGSEGTTTPTYIIPPQGNLISGNLGNGILVDGGSNNNILYGNFIGTTNDGNEPLPNDNDGVCFIEAPNNSILGCEVYNNPFVFYNVISGNNKNGVQIFNSDGCIIQGNFIGITMNNQAVCPNQLDGLLVNGQSHNVITGGVIPLGNVISGNNANGIHITDDVTNFISYNTFAGGFAFGDAAPNQQNGILVDGHASHNILRTNVVSGNIENGVLLTENSSYTTIKDIICGTDSNTSTAIPNKNGLTISGFSSYNSIYSTASVAYDNVFSGNSQNGIQLLENSSYNTFKDCIIGLSINSTKQIAIPNGTNGVFLDGNTNNNKFTENEVTFRNIVNIISGNTNCGVFFNSLNPKNNIFTNNYMGINKFNESFPNQNGNFGGYINNSNTINPNYV